LQAVGDIPFLGLFVGAATTAVIQSSSATIGILQELYTTGSIPLIGAVAIVMGDNIGTTVTAVFASIGGSIAAKRTALAHVLFNVIGSFVFMIFIIPYTAFIQLLEDRFIDTTVANNMKLTISFAHMGFNILNTIIFFFLIKQLVWMVTKLIKGDDNLIETDVDLLQYDLIEESPILALESAKLVVLNMGKVTKQMFEGVIEYSFENKKRVLENGQQIEEMLDTIDQKVHDYLVKIVQFGLDEDSSQLQASYVDTIRDFERIGDHCTNLYEFFEHRYENKIALSKAAHDELARLYEVVLETITLALDAFESQDKEIARKVMELEDIIDRLVIKNRKRHIMRLNNIDSEENVDGYYVDILSNVERIGDHCNNIAVNIIQESYYNDELDYE